MQYLWHLSDTKSKNISFVMTQSIDDSRVWCAITYLTDRGHLRNEGRLPLARHDTRHVLTVYATYIWKTHTRKQLTEHPRIRYVGERRVIWAIGLVDTPAVVDQWRHPVINWTLIPRADTQVSLAQLDRHVLDSVLPRFSKGQGAIWKGHFSAVNGPSKGHFSAVNGPSKEHFSAVNWRKKSVIN